jgi:hypothetical protein
VVVVEKKGGEERRSGGEGGEVEDTKWRRRMAPFEIQNLGQNLCGACVLGAPHIFFDFLFLQEKNL